jgi:hypothetical protein
MIQIRIGGTCDSSTVNGGGVTLDNDHLVDRNVVVIYYENPKKIKNKITVSFSLHFLSIEFIQNLRIFLKLHSNYI